MPAVRNEFLCRCCRIALIAPGQRAAAYEYLARHTDNCRPPPMIDYGDLGRIEWPSNRHTFRSRPRSESALWTPYGRPDRCFRRSIGVGQCDMSSGSLNPLLNFVRQGTFAPNDYQPQGACP